jgi:hypothetical protein
VTPEGRWLVRAYYIAQGGLSTALERRLRQLWRLLVAGRIADTSDLWLAAVTAAIAVGYGRSTDVAAAFQRRFSLAELGEAVPALVRPELDQVRVRQLMLAAGPGLIRANLAKGLTFEDAARRAEYWSTGAGTREVLSGGRELLRSTAAQDSRVLGWARQAGGDACAFCAMLASRGPVYREDTADFETHIGCGCLPVPVYSTSQGWPDNSERFREEWDRSDGTLQGFRRHLDEVRGDQGDLADTA